jgi:hypothetical protein
MAMNQTWNVPTGSERVWIEIREPHVAIIDPIDSVEHLLTRRLRIFAADAKHGYHERMRNECVAEPYGEQRLFSAGYLRRVVEHLEDVGYEVEVDDRRPTVKDLGASLSVREAASGRRRDWLEAVRDQPLGQFEIRNEQEALDFCALVAEYFPDCRIVVAVPSKAMVYKYADRLGRELAEGVDARASGFKVSKVVTRVSVSTFTYIRKDGFDILLLPHARSLLDVDPLYRVLVEHGDVARRYVMTPLNRKRDAYDEWRLEEIAGPVLCSPARQRPLIVAMLPGPKCRIDGATTPEGRKRQLFACNKARNGWIAGLATALTKDAKKTATALLDSRRAFDVAARSNVQVAVLVESAEHARQLAGLLTDWHLCVGRDDARHGFPANGQSRHMIVTATAAAQSGIDADIVIRATGTSSPLRRQDFLIGTDNDRSSRILLLDFDDAFHKHAAKQSQQRRRDYERHGLRIVDVRPIDFRSFINRIPAREVNPYQAGGDRDCGLSSAGRLSRYGDDAQRSAQSPLDVIETGNASYHPRITGSNDEDVVS